MLKRTIKNKRYLIMAILLTVIVVIFGSFILMNLRKEKIYSYDVLPWATSTQNEFDVVHINDGSPAAWGSTEGTSDVFVCVILSNPMKIDFLKVQLFSPSGKSHLRDFSVVATNDDPREIKNSNWIILRSRIGKKGIFSKKNTLPEDELDNTIITVEINPKDLINKKYNVYGIACLRETRGDKGNYAGGSGMYIRELQLGTK